MQSYLRVRPFAFDFVIRVTYSIKIQSIKIDSVFVALTQHVIHDVYK